MQTFDLIGVLVFAVSRVTDRGSASGGGHALGGVRVAGSAADVTAQVMASAAWWMAATRIPPSRANRRGRGGIPGRRRNGFPALVVTTGDDIAAGCPLGPRMRQEQAWATSLTSRGGGVFSVQLLAEPRSGTRG
ncbi:hypothetical protein [Geodermatophilus sp. SYSU D01105]